MNRIRTSLSVVFAFGLLALAGSFTLDSVCSAQENGSLLQITAPAPNAIANPGQAVPVSVSSPSNAAFSREAS